MDILLYIIGIYIGTGMIYLGTGFIRASLDSKSMGLAKDFVEASVLEKTMRIVLTVFGWPYWVYIEVSISNYIRKITKRTKGF